MPEVLIRYCLPCRYQAKAIQDADAILKEFGGELSALRLVPGDHGVYDVEVDGHLVFSLDRAERFPETSELIQTIRTRIEPRKSRKK
ncbi:MAG: SelT/SelW/SelH family protein [Thermoplasmata archaeon]